jgi:hypothetical protein
LFGFECIWGKGTFIFANGEISYFIGFQGPEIYRDAQCDFIPRGYSTALHEMRRCSAETAVGKALLERYLWNNEAKMAPRNSESQTPYDLLGYRFAQLQLRLKKH